MKTVRLTSTLGSETNVPISSLKKSLKIKTLYSAESTDCLTGYLWQLPSKTEYSVSMAVLVPLSKH